MGNTYDDPAKKLAREKLAYFIQKHVLSHKRPKDVRVMCFPGAEKEGEEALEVREVYDSLRIPRQNIVGVECVPEVADRLRSANLGINVRQQRVKNYFLHTQDAPFDVISLDYMGQQTLEEALTLEIIASRQMLNNHGVLSTNYFGSRESESMRRLFALRWANMTLSDVANRTIFAKRNTREDAMKAVYEYLDKVQALGDGEDIDKLRDAISLETLNIFRGGTINYPLAQHFYRDHPSRVELDQRVLRDTIADREKRAEEAARGNGLSFKTNLDYLRETDESAFHKTSFRHMYHLAEADLVSGGASLGLAQALLGAFHANFQRAYFAEALERYQYTSNKGSSMLFDLFAFTHLPGDILSLSKKVFAYNNDPEGEQIFLNPRKLQLADFAKLLVKLQDRFSEVSKTVFHPRKILAPPVFDKDGVIMYIPTEKEKSRIYGLIREGERDEVIIHDYHINERQLAAYKAHVTMQERNQKSSNAAGA